MATETVTPGQVAPLHRPGHCAIHPDQALLTHEAAGERRYYRLEDPPTICPACPLAERERCTFCGGRLYEPNVRPWQISQRRAFCGASCRLHAHRARRRADR